MPVDRVHYDVKPMKIPNITIFLWPVKYLFIRLHIRTCYSFVSRSLSSLQNSPPWCEAVISSFLFNPLLLACAFPLFVSMAMPSALHQEPRPACSLISLSPLSFCALTLSFQWVELFKPATVSSSSNLSMLLFDFLSPIFFPIHVPQNALFDFPLSILTSKLLRLPPGSEQCE